MKPFIIVGAGQFAEYVEYLIEKALNYEVVAFSVNRKYITDTHKNSKLVVPFEDLPQYYPPTEYNVAIGFLGKDMFSTRGKLMAQCIAWGYELPNLIHPTVVNETEKMGYGNIIGASTTMAAFSQIGNGNVFFDAGMIAHNVVVGDLNLFAAAICPQGNCIIGNHCYIGGGSIILNKVHIADYTLVGAGSCVKQSTNPYDVLVPARSITLENKISTDFGL